MFTVMPSLRLRTAICTLAVAIVFVCLIASRPPSKSYLNVIHHPAVNSQLDWGVAEQIFVISLPNRADRRAVLSPLWKAHQLERIQYVNATSVGEPEIDRILAYVRKERRRQYAYKDAQSKRPSFKDGLGRHPEELWGSDLWTLESLSPDKDLLDSDVAYPIPCERGNPFNPRRAVSGSHYAAAAPTEMVLRKIPLLSRPMIACWHSHLRVIRQISILGTTAEQSGVKYSNHSNGRTYIVLEDDVDFEWNIKNFLSPIWDALPSDWEVVMLGHCWSDERRHPPRFQLLAEPSLNTAGMNISLHPSNSPLCTHAYALSPRGATHLYNLLRHPAFAYSRALDQAFAWLIRSGNLKGVYSIVPSLVVQTKHSESDISERKGGSRWRDALMDSSRERLQTSDLSRWWRRRNGSGMAHHSVTSGSTDGWEGA